MLARTMIEGGIENRGIRKLHRNLRVPSAACYSYTIPRNRHFRNWTSIMPISTRTNCISGGHTIPVWELPIVQDWHKSRFIVGNLYTQRPFTRPLRASNQLGWVLYKREPSDWDLREPQAGCPTPQGRLRGTSHGYSTHELCFFIPFIVHPTCPPGHSSPQ